MALLDFALDKWLHSLDVPVVLYTFVDDWQVLHQHIAHHPEVIDKLDSFVRAIQMDVDRKKSFTWASQASDRAHLRQQDLAVVQSSRTLGAHTNYTRQCGNSVLVQRVNDMKAMWKLFRASLSSFSKKCIALRMMAWPRALHGVSVVRVGKSHFGTLRTNAVRGLRNDRVGTNPIAHLSTIGFTYDPEGWAIVQTLKDARSFAPEGYFRDMMIEAVHLQTPIPNNGPVQILLDRVGALGWSVNCHGFLQDEVGSFDIFMISIGELNLRFAWSWPAVMARELSHRASFAGIQAADLGEVQRLSSCFTQSDMVYLRCAWDGTMYTQKGKQQWVSDDANLCKWCSQVDSFEHRLWICPHFQKCRELVPSTVLKEVDDLPPCLRNHAWPVRLDSQVQFFQHLDNIPEVPAGDYRLDHIVGQSFDLFVDGACLLPKDRVCRIASFAVTMALTWAGAFEHEVITAGHVPGVLQSPFRAELWGLLRALQIAVKLPGQIRIWTDCAGVLSRARLLQIDQCIVKPNQRHGDLWLKVFQQLQLLGSRVSFHKVVSHIEVGIGQTEVECWAYWHNGLVDAAASAMNHRRSDAFLQVWEQSQRETVHSRELHLEIAKHAVRVGKLANEDRERTTSVNPRWVSNALKYGSMDNHLEVPSAMTISPVFSKKFGVDFANHLQTWWLGTGHGFLQTSVQLRWISFAQLFCDFMMSTGERGPWLRQGRWVIGHVDLPADQHPTFSQQSRWFQMALKQYWSQNKLLIRSKLQRPSSASLQCWMNSALISWSVTRLDVEAYYLPLGYE